MTGGAALAMLGLAALVFGRYGWRHADELAAPLTDHDGAAQARNKLRRGAAVCVAAGVVLVVVGAISALPGV